MGRGGRDEGRKGWEGGGRGIRWEGKKRGMWVDNRMGRKGREGWEREGNREAWR